MRDPKRIQAFCNQLADMWRTVPDWRFGQLIVNLLRAFDETGQDLFFVEDEELLRFIQKFFYEGTS